MRYTQVDKQILEQLLDFEIKSFSLKIKENWIDIYFEKLECKVEDEKLILDWKGKEEKSVSHNVLEIKIEKLQFDSKLDLLCCSYFEANFKKEVNLNKNIWK